MRCQNCDEWKKLARIRYLSHLLRSQAWNWWFTTFFHDRWDRSRLQKKKWGTTLPSNATSSGSTCVYNKLVDKALSTGSMVTNGEKRGSLWIEENPDESLSYSSFLDKRCSSFPARSAQLVELNTRKEPLVFRNLKFNANTIIRRTAFCIDVPSLGTRFCTLTFNCSKKLLSKVRQNFRSQWFLLQKGSNLPFQALKSSKFFWESMPRTPLEARPSGLSVAFGHSRNSPSSKSCEHPWCLVKQTCCWAFLKKCSFVLIKDTKYYKAFSIWMF